MAANFLDELGTYVLSREWKDMLAIYAFKLHPTPHCSSEHVRYQFFGWARVSSLPSLPACRDDATVLQLAAFAGALLLVGSLLSAAVGQRHGGLLSRAPGVFGMCVGWAAGDAMARWRDGAVGEAVWQQLGFALAWSAAACLLLVARPEPHRWSEGRCAAVGAACSDLLFRAASVTVVMAWAYASSRAILAGLPPEQAGGALHRRLLLLWALSLSVALSAAATSLHRHRQSLGAPPLRGADKLAVEVTARRRRAALLRPLLALADRVSGGVTGSAWCNVYFATAASAAQARPTWQLALGDAAAACAFTVAGVGVASLLPHARLSLEEAAAVQAATSRRAAVEAYFARNAFSYFAGWAWIVELRDLAALLGQQAVASSAKREANWLGFAPLDQAELHAFAGQWLAFGLFGPGLTALVCAVYVVMARCARRGEPRAEERLEGPQHEVQMLNRGELNRGEEGTDSEE